MQEQVQQNQEVTVSLTLTISEVNTIIAGLDEIPHKFSRGLIDKISTQAREQLQTQQPEGPLGTKVIQ
jgi:hypothetical protein